MSDYYAEYNRLIDLWYQTVRACNHEPKPYEVGFRSETVKCCASCWRAADPLSDRANAERKAARKRELDDMPRCMVDDCKRRGTGWTFGALLCGRHFKNTKRTHNKSMAGAGILGLLAPPHYTPAQILNMAEGGA